MNFNQKMVALAINLASVSVFFCISHTHMLQSFLTMNHINSVMHMEDQSNVTNLWNQEEDVCWCAARSYLRNSRVDTSCSESEREKKKISKYQAWWVIIHTGASPHIQLSCAQSHDSAEGTPRSMQGERTERRGGDLKTKPGLPTTQNI